MQKIYLKCNELPRCDVLVAGGGSAGVAAAVSAARSGAKTILIEKNTFLGGLATGGLVTPMMKNALNAKKSLTKGIFLEITKRLAKAGGGARFKDGNPGWFNPEIYKIVLDEICTEAGIKLIFDSQIIRANVKDKKIKDIVFFNKSGLFSISAKEFIDATGDGDLMNLTGVSNEKGKKRQAISLRFMMGGVDLKTLAGWLKKHDKTGDSPVYYLKTRDILLSTAFTFEKAWTLKPFFDKALKRGDLKKEDAAYFQIFSVPGAKDLIAFNCPRISLKGKVLDPLSYKDTTSALLKGREMIKRISSFCKKYLPGFKDAYISQIAPALGVRESRRLVGQYVLTKEDILTRKKFADAILSSNWPIDIHPSRRGGVTPPLRAPKNNYYQIPLRSLLPKTNEIKNLIVAGRCLSASFEAQSSARIQANCIRMGEAAGLLAAKRVKRK